MTNEEKATYIANVNQCIDRSGYSSFDECKDSALDMAEWKDQQFKEYLEKKKAENPLSYRSDWKSYENGIYHDIINEIINELFGE